MCHATLASPTAKTALPNMGLTVKRGRLARRELPPPHWMIRCESGQRKARRQRASCAFASRGTSRPSLPNRMKKSKKRWSQRVTEQSDALDLEEGIFNLTGPKRIALSLKHSAELSHRRKSDPYRSAMSMLNFLYQSRWDEIIRGPPGLFGKGQGRVAQGIPPTSLDRTLL
jgi:Protein of unknown function (DUF3175)